jgi:hypothetical protein
MTQLSGEDLQDLHGALLEAFPTLDSLAQLLTFHLGANLQTIAGGSNLSDATFKVLTWSEATGRTRALIAGAREENPGNERLATVAARLLPILDAPHLMDTIPWWRRLAARRANLLFGTGWILVLTLGVASTVVRLPASLTLDVEARVVTMKLDGRDDRDATLISGVRLASIAAQRVSGLSLNGGAAELISTEATAAVTGDTVSGFTLTAPGGAVLQIATSADEQGSLKVLLRQGSASALFKTARVRGLRCPECDDRALDHFTQAARGGGLLRVRGGRERMALLLESDRNSMALPDISVDVVDALSFDDRLDERTVSTIQRGTLTYRDAATKPVQIDPGARLRLSGLEAGSVTLTAGPLLKVHLVGRARRIAIVEGGEARDLRPTAFAVLARRPAVLAAVGVLLVFVSWPRFAGWNRPPWERAS